MEGSMIHLNLHPRRRWSRVFFKPLKKVCFQTEILGNLFKYILFVLFFCLLFPCRKDQFAASYFPTSFNNCTDPILGDPGAVSRVGRKGPTKAVSSTSAPFLPTRLTAPGSPRMYWFRSTSGRSGTTHWFVAVDLLIFYITGNCLVPRGLSSPSLDTPPLPQGPIVPNVD